MFRSGRPERDQRLPGPVGEGADDGFLLSPRPPADEFNDLFRSLSGRVHAYLLRSVSVHDAEDVLIETFTTVWLRWNDLPASESGRIAWVVAVAHNKLREHHRSAGRRDALTERVGRLISSAPDDPADTVADLERTRTLLRQLPPGEADAIALTVFAGLTTEQAAEILGCPRSTVTTRTQRARQHLNELIAREVTDGT